MLTAACALGAAPAKIVLVAGKPSHPPGAHEFNAGVLLLENFLKQNKGVQPVVVKGGWPEDESVFENARTIVFFMDGFTNHPIIQGNRLETVGRLMDKGVGFVALHYAVEVPKDNGGPQFLKWMGGFYDRPYSKNPVNDIETTQACPPNHPIARGWKSFRARDEWYYSIRFDSNDKSVIPVLTAMLPPDAPEKQTLAWAKERPDGGRGFGFTGGHFHTNWGIPDFRKLIVNAILWTAKVDVPAGGAKCDLNLEDLKKNLDDKPTPAPRKKKQ